MKLEDIIKKYNIDVKALNEVKGSFDSLFLASIKELRLILVSNIKRAELIKEDLNKLSKKAHIINERSILKEDFNRIKAIEKLYNSNDIIIVTAYALKDKYSTAKKWNKKRIKLRKGDEITHQKLLDILVELGYKRKYNVDYYAEFSKRGDIIDVFSPLSENPIRIDFFSDQIESIRYFDINTKRSIEEVESFTITRAKELEEKDKSIFELIDKKTAVIDEHIFEILKENEDEDSIKILKQIKPISIKYDSTKNSFGYKEESLNMLPTKKYSSNLNLLVEDILRYTAEKKKVYILTELKKDVIKNLVYENELKNVTIIDKTLKSGFISDIVVITENDIFSRTKSRTSSSFNENRKPIHSFYELKKGDFVVHKYHGIGLYEGIVEKEVEKNISDYLIIKYKNDDRLFIPIDKLNLIQKYIGKELKDSSLNRLGSLTWSNKIKNAKKSIEELSQKLIDLYAKRLNTKAIAFEKDNHWQLSFEEEFEFKETKDQLRAIEEIKLDMQKPYPMDRLLCGDVGFGKTEVAIRAIFKAVLNYKQVLVLVPTTILCEQHYRNFIKRFSSFPVKIEKLSRLITKKKKESVIKDLKTNKVDIVIATHMGLAKDIEFYDLGLLVIDEEQRFGVAHKEKIKMIKEGIDSLSLSATPIPRTLNMSLGGIRDMSVINEPPKNRHPISTYLLEYDESKIVYAINKEINRGGQIYYVFNNIKGITQKVESLRELFNDVNIDFCHGRMKKTEIENKMLDFVNKEIDILVSTTIIETGMDIKNVNTIIVENAQNFGLAQLYQLRGRVGRWDREAYCYLIYPKNKILSETSKKRLDTIKEFTDFGSGFSIALRDLEIRGGGNILGENQSGHFETIGFELYMDMLNEHIDIIKGEEKEEEREILIDLMLDAIIPNSYISDEGDKINYYRIISNIRNLKEYEDIKNEFKDIYGIIPKELNNLLDISYLRALLLKLPFKNIREFKDFYRLDFDIDLDIKQEIIKKLAKEFDKKIEFTFKNISHVKIYEIKNIKELIAHFENVT